MIKINKRPTLPQVFRGLNTSRARVLEGSMAKFAEFVSDDAGAVTIDWVALGSAILLLGIMVVYAIYNKGVAGLVLAINSDLTSITAPDVGIAASCAEVNNC